jgi:hypothetical protein
MNKITNRNECQDNSEMLRKHSLKQRGAVGPRGPGAMFQSVGSEDPHDGVGIAADGQRQSQQYTRLLRIEVVSDQKAGLPQPSATECAAGAGSGGLHDDNPLPGSLGQRLDFIGRAEAGGEPGGDNASRAGGHEGTGRRAVCSSVRV